MATKKAAKPKIITTEQYVRRLRRRGLPIVAYGYEPRHELDEMDFTIVADPKNELEITIVRAIQRSAHFQAGLEMVEPNRKFHPEGKLGIHVQQGLEYLRTMASRYIGWKRDQAILAPAFMLHDICKPDEEFYDDPRVETYEVASEGSHRVPHQMLAWAVAEMFLGFHDETLLRIIRHHDDHYKLKKKLEGYRGPIAKKRFKKHFEEAGFTPLEMEILTRFGFMDRYRERPTREEDLPAHEKLRALLRGQMTWFTEMAKQTDLLTGRFKPPPEI